MEATIVRISGDTDGPVRTTYEADDEHTLARRIDAALDEAKAKGRQVRVELNNHVAMLMEKHGYVRTVIDIRLSTSSMPRGTRGLPHGAYSGPVGPGALLPGTHRAENEPPTQEVNQLVSSSVLSFIPTS